MFSCHMARNCWTQVDKIFESFTELMVTPAKDSPGKFHIYFFWLVTQEWLTHIDWFNKALEKTCPANQGYHNQKRFEWEPQEHCFKSMGINALLHWFPNGL